MLNELVIPAVRDGGGFTSVRGFQGIPQRDIHFTTTFVRSYAQELESSIGSDNRSRPVRSRFAWQMSIRRRWRLTSIAGWRLAVPEDGWSSSSNWEDKPEHRSAHADGPFGGADQAGRVTGTDAWWLELSHRDQRISLSALGRATWRGARCDRASVSGQGYRPTPS